MKPLYDSQAVVLTVMTGTMMCKPEALKKELEKRLGRVINPTEFMDNGFIKQVQHLFIDDFQKLCTTVPDSGIMLFK